MTSAAPTLLALTLLLHPAGARADPESTERPIDAQVVRDLLGATEVGVLDATFARADPSDAALVAAYRWRRLQLVPTPGEELRYLRALPATGAELAQVSDLSFVAGLRDDLRISEVVDGMFERAARLVARHGRFHRRFIQLCDLTDGALGEVAWPAYDWLLENDAARTVAALRALPSSVRTRLCGGPDPVALPTAEAVDQCRSEL
jgi:hypothetical protein